MDTARAAAEPDTAKTDGTEPPSNALSPLAVPADMQLADKVKPGFSTGRGMRLPVEHAKLVSSTLDH